jgi:adenylate cyclase
VHVASRLEQLTKDYNCDLVISEEVARRTGLDVSGYPQHLLTLRNRTAPLEVRIIQDARQLADILT